MGGVIYGIVYGLVNVITMLIQFFFIHLVATMMLGGTGTFVGLVRKLTIFTAMVFLIVFVASFAYYLISFNLSLQALNEINANPSAMETASTSLDSLLNLSAVYGVASLIFGVIYLYLFSKRIGLNYEFGAGRGCASLILGNILLGVVACGLVYALTTALMTTMLPSMSITGVLVPF